jgi:ribonuclease VapC
VLRREPGFEDLRERLLATGDVRISAGTLLECRMIAERYDVMPELEALLDAVGTQVVAFDARQLEAALDGFRRFGKGRHAAGLDLGDLFAYGRARALDEPPLFKGQDFTQTDLRRA